MEKKSRFSFRRHLMTLGSKRRTFRSMTFSTQFAFRSIISSKAKKVKWMNEWINVITESNKFHHEWCSYSLPQQSTRSYFGSFMKDKRARREKLQVANKLSFFHQFPSFSSVWWWNNKNKKILVLLLMFALLWWKTHNRV